MTFASYSVGTVSVAANGTVVTGSGTVWSGVNARPGDILQIDAFQTIVSDVTDVTHLAIPTWGGGAQSAVAYTLWLSSPLRFAGGQAMSDVSALISTLNGRTFYTVIGASPTADGLTASEGQYALKTNAGAWQLWLWTSGAWVLQSQPAGVIYRGEWSGATPYVTNDRVSRSGQSFTAKQNSTNHDPATDTSFVYWDGGGVKGDTGAAGATWTSGTAVPSGGNDGDFYFRSSTGDVYKKTSGTWSIDANLTGATGAAAVVIGTSVSAVTVGLGSKSFTTQSGISWAAGQRLRAFNTAGDRIMVGLVSAYSGTSLTLAVDVFQGVGADSSWTITIAGETGQQGGTGITGSTGQKGDTGSTGAASTIPGPQGAKGDVGAGLAPNASGTLAQRTSFDGQAQGYEYLQTDVAPFRLYVKASNTTGDWAGPTYIGGNFPVGDMGHITDSIVQTFDFGHIV